MRRAKITALGCYTPPRLLTNADLEKIVDTTDEWIMSRTGVRQRHIADPDVATSDLAVEAARAALAQRGIDAAELDAIIVCTVTPDMMFPSTACLVQHRLGAKGAWGFDLIAACSGFDYTDRATCVLFGDGAGAMLVEPSQDGESGLIDYMNEIDGSGGPSLNMPAGGSRMPASVETVEKRLHYVHQDGPQVFKFAVRKMHEACRDLLERNHLKGEDVRVMIPHQANLRIISATADRLGLASDRVVINIDSYGNTTAGTIPLATRDALTSGRLKQGDIVLFAAVGAGYTVGASLWRWAY